MPGQSMAAVWSLSVDEWVGVFHVGWVRGGNVGGVAEAAWNTYRNDL